MILRCRINLPEPSRTSFRIGKQRTAVETEVHTILVGHDVAEAVLHWLAGEGEADCHCIPVHKRFDCVGRFFEDDFAERESKACDAGIVRGQRIEQPAIGRARHDGQTSTDLIGCW